MIANIIGYTVLAGLASLIVGGILFWAVLVGRHCQKVGRQWDAVSRTDAIRQQRILQQADIAQERLRDLTEKDGRS
jgi:hypothetical protein